MSDLEIRRRKQEDQDDVMHAITEEILRRRQLGHQVDVFPKYFYCNTRVWEDEVGPQVAAMLTQMQIQVRTHPLIPWDTFTLTRDELSARDVGLMLRQGEIIGQML